jgi:hypothetical protein
MIERSKAMTGTLINTTKKDRTTSELKEIVVTALKDEYGFAPKKSEITLLESSGDGTYILFRVRNIEYSFDSYHMEGWTVVPGYTPVWCGEGTITRKGRV